MTTHEISEQLQQVFRQVFNDQNLQLNPESASGDIPGWDSLTHMTLIAETEEAFGITFGFEEVSRLKKVGDLVQLISDKRR